jgi:trigger factor
MAPTGLLQKMYGKSIIAEQMNKLLSDGLNKYLKDNNVPILGEPIFPESKQPEVDFENQEDFEFIFDIALVPDFEIELSKEDKIRYYEIEPSDEMVENQKNTYAQNFGKHVRETNVEELDTVKGSIEELENGEVKADGRKLPNAVLMPKFMKDDAQKALFIGAEVGAEINFNPAKAFDNEAEIASLLKIEKEDAKNVTADFRFTIEEITRYHTEINQELYDKVFGENIVKSEEEFTAKIKEDIVRSLKSDSDYKFLMDARDYLLAKYAGIEFPEEFMKRWIKNNNAKVTGETIEKEFPKMLEAIKWQIITDKLLKANHAEIKDEDIEFFAKRTTIAQFAQYGIYNASEEYIENFVKEMLKKEETVKNITERVIEEKVSEIIQKSVEFDKESISYDEFSKLYGEN